MFKSMDVRKTKNIFKPMKTHFMNLISLMTGADPGGPRGQGPLTTKMRPQQQNSTKLRPQNGSFRP